MSKITLIGPVSHDTIQKNNYRYISTGGAVFYQSNVLASLQIKTRAFITISEGDKELLKAFPKTIDLHPLYVKDTIKFQNIYPDDNPNYRVQKAVVPKNPIKNILDHDQISDADVLLLGPLCPYDIPLETIKELSKLNIPIYLGAQGYLRHLEADKIILRPWKNFKRFLHYIDILFMDENESAILLGKKYPIHETAKILASFGPEEVVITCGDRGSIIYSSKEEKTYNIPAFRAQTIEDPTGLGDTYMAAYAAKKLEEDDPEKCGMFAAAASSIKLENKGPFRGKKQLIHDRFESQMIQ